MPLIENALPRAETLLVAESATVIRLPAPWVTNVLLPADVPLPRFTVPPVIDRPARVPDEVSVTVELRSVKAPLETMIVSASPLTE